MVVNNVWFPRLNLVQYLTLVFVCNAPRSNSKDLINDGGTRSSFSPLMQNCNYMTRLNQRRKKSLNVDLGATNDGERGSGDQDADGGTPVAPYAPKQRLTIVSQINLVSNRCVADWSI
jgi:hypothetical protein